MIERKILSYKCETKKMEGCNKCEKSWCGQKSVNKWSDSGWLLKNEKVKICIRKYRYWYCGCRLLCFSEVIWKRRLWGKTIDHSKQLLFREKIGTKSYWAIWRPEIEWEWWLFDEYLTNTSFIRSEYMTRRLFKYTHGKGVTRKEWFDWLFKRFRGSVKDAEIVRKVKQTGFGSSENGS